MSLRSKEFDYSKEAKMAHARLLTIVDNLERRGIKTSVNDIHKQEYDRSIKAAVQLLKAAFDCTDRVERKVLWQDFKRFIKKYRLEVSMPHLVRMRRIYNKQKGS